MHELTLRPWASHMLPRPMKQAISHWKLRLHKCLQQVSLIQAMLQGLNYDMHNSVAAARHLYHLQIHLCTEMVHCRRLEYVMQLCCILQYW